VASTSELLSLGETNTRTMIDELLGDLGYDDVTVIFAASADTAASV
jgi:hypothetical protein